MKNFHCQQCGNQIFFESVTCVHCGAMLGFVPEKIAMYSFERLEDGTCSSWGEQKYIAKPCANYVGDGVCNWMVNVDEANGLCESCRLTSIIPSLDDGKNVAYWRDMEAAKRRLLYSLLVLNLEPFAKKEDGQPVMSFQFLDPKLTDEEIITGHRDGEITLNVEEADSVERERCRKDLGEHYRTLLGHFRHESGHAYFERLIANGPWLDEFRTLFGDERLNYKESLEQYYSQGPNLDWGNSFISCYASSHPWEDWAETWAHCLHMIDTVETARACGIVLAPVHPQEPSLPAATVSPKNDLFKNLIDDWFALTYVINSLNRSMGMPDAYPFSISQAAQQKLEFVHRVIQAQNKVLRSTGQDGNATESSNKNPPTSPTPA
jgi:hypothetical protein